MKNLVILGAGTSGTMMANHLVSKLPKKTWKITIVDQYKTHYYQPGFLFLPFDTYTEDQVKKVGKKFIPKGVNYIQKKIDKILPEENKKTGDQDWPYRPAENKNKIISPPVTRPGEIKNLTPLAPSPENTEELSQPALHPDWARLRNLVPEYDIVSIRFNIYV